jgi:hypothetical protein
MKPYNGMHVGVITGIADMMEEVLTCSFSLFLGKDTDGPNRNW